MSHFNQRLLNIKPASESISDKITKQKEKNALLKKKVEERDKQIAANKKRIQELEKEKEEEKAKNKPSSSYLSLFKYIKGSK